MLYRKISASGDYIFGAGANTFYSGTLAVSQAIYTSIRLLQGEFWEDTSQGLPLFQNILGQSGNPEHIRGTDMLIQEAILGVQGVIGISSFSSSYANRKYTMNATVQSQYGDVILQEVIF